MPKSLLDDLRVFRAIEGSTENPSLMFGIETALWPVAAKNAAKSYRERPSKQPNGSFGGTRIRQN